MRASSSQIRQFAAVLTRRRLSTRWRRLAAEHRERWAGPGAGRGPAEAAPGRAKYPHLPPVFQPQVPGPDRPSERDRVSASLPPLGIVTETLWVSALPFSSGQGRGGRMMSVLDQGGARILRLC